MFQNPNHFHSHIPLALHHQTLNMLKTPLFLLNKDLLPCLFSCHIALLPDDFKVVD